MRIIPNLERVSKTFTKWSDRLDQLCHLDGRTCLYKRGSLMPNKPLAVFELLNL